MSLRARSAAFLFLLGLTAHAGDVPPENQNVLVCGFTSFYTNFGNPKTPALLGYQDRNRDLYVNDADRFDESGHEIPRKKYRIEGYQRIRRYLADNNDNAKYRAIADYKAATAFEDYFLCLRGNLIDREYRGTIRTYIVPTAIRIYDRKESYLNPSEITGVYSDVDGRLLDIDVNVAAENLEDGLRFSLPAVIRMVAEKYKSECSVSNYASFAVERRTRSTLGAKLEFICGKSSPFDKLYLGLEFKRQNENTVRLTATATRPTTEEQIVFSFEKTK